MTARESFEEKEDLKRNTLLLANVAVALLGAAAAHADFTVTAAGPINSTGAAGDAGNGTINATYTGANSLFGTLNFSGDLTDGGVGTYKSEARWRITNSTLGGAADFQPTTGNGFSGTINVTKSVSVLAWANQNDAFSFEAFESFNDSGLDAYWTNVNFTFTGSVTPTNLGTYVSGTSLSFDTFTSSFDTELALYTAGGVKIAENDDAGSGLQSEINAGVLADGNYLLVAGGYNSSFGNGFAFGGAASGSLNVNVNGSSVFAGDHATNNLDTFAFSVGPVPEPGTLAVLGLGLVPFLRRRRK